MAGLRLGKPVFAVLALVCVTAFYLVHWVLGPWPLFFGASFRVPDTVYLCVVEFMISISLFVTAGSALVFNHRDLLLQGIGTIDGEGYRAGVVSSFCVGLLVPLVVVDGYWVFELLRTSGF